MLIRILLLILPALSMGRELTPKKKPNNADARLFLNKFFNNYVLSAPTFSLNSVVTKTILKEATTTTYTTTYSTCYQLSSSLLPVCNRKKKQLEWLHAPQVQAVQEPYPKDFAERSLSQSYVGRSFPQSFIQPWYQAPALADWKFAPAAQRSYPLGLLARLYEPEPYLTNFEQQPYQMNYNPTHGHYFDNQESLGQTKEADEMSEIQSSLKNPEKSEGRFFLNKEYVSKTLVTTITSTVTGSNTYTFILPCLPLTGLQGNLCNPSVAVSTSSSSGTTSAG